MMGNGVRSNGQLPSLGEPNVEKSLWFRATLVVLDKLNKHLLGFTHRSTSCWSQRQTNVLSYVSLNALNVIFVRLDNEGFPYVVYKETQHTEASVRIRCASLEFRQYTFSQLIG